MFLWALCVIKRSLSSHISRSWVIWKFWFVIQTTKQAKDLEIRKYTFFQANFTKARHSRLHYFKVLENRRRKYFFVEKLRKYNPTWPQQYSSRGNLKKNNKKWTVKFSSSQVGNENK